MVCFLVKDFFFTPKIQKSVNETGKKNIAETREDGNG